MTIEATAKTSTNTIEESTKVSRNQVTAWRKVRGVSNTTSVYETLHAEGPQSASPLNLPTDGVLYFAAFWDRGMSSAEMAGLAQNPWQLVRSTAPRIYSVGLPNNPPVVVDGSGSVVEGQTLSGDVISLATDANDDVLTFAEVGGPLPGLTLNADGTFTYAAPFGTVGDVTFQFEADDGTDVSNTGTFTITVTERTGGGLLDLRLASPLSDFGNGQPPFSGGFGLKIL